MIATVELIYAAPTPAKTLTLMLSNHLKGVRLLDQIERKIQADKTLGPWTRWNLTKLDPPPITR